MRRIPGKQKRIAEVLLTEDAVEQDERPRIRIVAAIASSGYLMAAPERLKACESETKQTF